MRWQILRSEAKRLWPMIAVVLAGVLVFGDTAQLAVQLYQLSMVGLVVIVFHVGRKTLFPYLDLSRFCETAEENGIGSGLVVLGMFLFLAAMIVAATVR